MSATNSTIDSLYKELTELEAKLQEIDASYSLDESLPEFVCKINYTLILNPVVAADGVTYDRAFITSWLEKHDISPWTREELEHKNLSKNLDFSSRLIEELKKEKERVLSRLSAAAIDIAKKELPANSSEANKTEVQPNERALSNDVSSLAVFPANVDFEPALTPVSEEILLPIPPAPIFFSPASHSGSQSSSSASSSVQTVFLNEHDNVWQRCLELRRLVGFVADTTDIGESPILNADEAKQKYVNIVAFIEEQMEQRGEILISTDLELIQRSLVVMTEYTISIPDGRVIDPNNIVQLSADISEYVVEAEPNAEASMPASIHGNLPPPLTVSTPAAASLLRNPISAPSSLLISSSLLPPSESSSFPTISLCEEDPWKRCVELKNLLGLRVDRGSSPNIHFFCSSAAVKQKYVNTISWIEEKFSQNGRPSILEAREIQQTLQPMTMLHISTPDGRVIDPDSISLLHRSIFRDLATAPKEQIEVYTQLVASCAKLDRLVELMRSYSPKYSALLDNAISLHDSIKDKIDEYKMRYPSLEPSREIILPPSFSVDLPPEAALETLMDMLRMHFYEHLSHHNKNSHIFTPGYHLVSNKFESVPFSPCGEHDEPASSGLTLFSADQIDTSRLKKELEMLGIPARVERSKIQRFRHGDSIVGGVRIVFDCVDPVIFNVAIELQRIRYQHVPQSVVGLRAQSEPAVLRSSLLSSSLFLRNSELGSDPNPNQSSRFSKQA